MKFVLTVCFSIISFCLTYSQDKIIFTSGKEKKCTIISEDSLIVKAILKKDGKETTAEISRNYIQLIKYESNLKNRKRITLTDGTTLDGTIIRNDSVSMSVNILVNGLEKTIFLAKSKVIQLDEPQNFEDIRKLYLKNSYSINIGPSIPYGNYSESINITTGHANIGVNIAANLSLGINPYLNIGLKSYALINSLDQKNEDAFWKSVGLLGGLELKIPLNILDLRFKGLGGLLFIESPEFNLNSISSFNQVLANCWGYDLGFNIDIKTFANSYIMINLDYIYGNFKFSKPKAVTEIQGISLSNFGSNFIIPGDKEESYNQEFKVLNVNIGIGYYF